MITTRKPLPQRSPRAARCSALVSIVAIMKGYDPRQVMFDENGYFRQAASRHLTNMFRHQAHLYGMGVH